MQFKKIMLAILLGTFFAAPAQLNIPSLKDEKIELAKDMISSEIYYSGIKRKGMSVAKWALIIGGSAYAAYWLLSPSAATAAAATVPASCPAGAADIPATLKDIQEIRQLIPLPEPNPDFPSVQWLKVYVKPIARYMAISLALNATASTAYDHYRKNLQNETLLWCLARKTRIVPSFDNSSGTVLLFNSLLNESKNYANAIKKSVAVDEITTNKQLIAGACSSMMVDMEQILGFMEFKAAQLDATSIAGETAISRKEQAQVTIRYIYNSANTFGQKISLLLADTTKTAKMLSEDITTELNAFDSELNVLLTTFQRLESEQSKAA